MTYYKLLRPQSEQPGEWMPQLDLPLVRCRRGSHAVTTRGLQQMLRLNLVAYDSESLGRRARLVRRVGQVTQDVLLIWAADCGERLGRPRTRTIADNRQDDREQSQQALLQIRECLHGLGWVRQLVAEDRP